MAERVDLDAVDALCEAATPGPWFPHDRGVGWEIYIDPGDPYTVGENGRLPRQLPDGMRTDIERRGDAEFIAQSRTLLPALVAELRDLRAKVDAVRAVAAERQNRAAAYRTAAAERGVMVGQQWNLQQNADRLTAEAAEILAALGEVTGRDEEEAG